MSTPRLAIRLMAYGDAFGVREELVGDLLEEIARGRSQSWVCQQLIGMYAWACVTHLRQRARLTPHGVALALCAALLVSVSIASASRVLAAWLAFYYIAGMLSLFAHMATHTIGMHAGRARDDERG